jgi:transcription initiation factor TFIID subunit 5
MFTFNPVTSSNTTSVNPNAWEESTGLLSSLIPSSGSSNTTVTTNPQTFNAFRGALKLGPMPLPEDLRSETERVLREQAVVDRDIPAQYDLHYARPAAVPGLISPMEGELLPHPPTFKVVDIKREVEKVKDARKRIRLEPSVMSSLSSNANSAQVSAIRGRALPSICAYMLHDVPDGRWNLFFSHFDADVLQSSLLYFLR